MNFIFFQIDQIKVVFAQFLKMTQIFITDRVAFSKGRPLEFAGTDFSDIVDQLRSNRCLQFYFF
ncbi:MAG: hypothetical protein KAT31_04595 [Bacteroidales bacterium]|nr:hypothetical protein [Bacteroidales bacterium]